MVIVPSWLRLYGKLCVLVSNGRRPHTSVIILNHGTIKKNFAAGISRIKIGPSGVRALPVAAGTNEVGHYF